MRADVRELRTYAFTRARDGFAEASATPAFLALDVDALVLLAGDDAVRVKSEDEVYDAVARWLQHEPAAVSYTHLRAHETDS